VVVNSFQLFPSGSPVTAGLLGMKTVFALQFPLSGSQTSQSCSSYDQDSQSFQLPLSGSQLRHLPTRLQKPGNLSTPSLGITNYLTTKTKVYRLRGFQLPLSGSPYQHVEDPCGDEIAFNSLSRDHGQEGRVEKPSAAPFFQLPLSGSR